MPLFETVTHKIPSNLLKDRFLVPPFSLFDTKTGYWQERKRSWTSLGIKSEIGRGDNLLFGKGVDDFNNYRNNEKFGKCLPDSIGEAYGRSLWAKSTSYIHI